MQKIILLLMVVPICSSISSGAYFEIGDGDYEYDLQLDNDDVLLMTGGGADIINAFDHSYIEIQSTAPYRINVGGILDLNLNQNSTMDFFGGEVRGIDIYDNAQATLRGGQIGSIESYQYVSWWYGEPVDQHVEMIVRDWSHDTQTNLLTGTWNVDNDNDDLFDTFSIQLHDQTGYDKAIDNIMRTIVPEPGTLLLVGLGGVAVRGFGRNKSVKI